MRFGGEWISNSYMRGRTVVMLAAVLLGCRNPMSVLDGYERLDPVPPEYIGWWREVEACSGLRGDFTRWTWMYAPGVQYLDGQAVGGTTYHELRTTVMAEPYVHAARKVRHEMLHALGVRGEQPVYFVDKCGEWVSH